MLMLALVAGFSVLGQAETSAFVETYNSCAYRVWNNGQWDLKENYEKRFVFVYNADNSNSIKQYYDGELQFVYTVLECCDENLTDDNQQYTSGTYLDHQGDRAFIAYMAGKVLITYPQLNQSYIFYNE